MERVICVICGDRGYTASPQYARCECGGPLTVVRISKVIKKERRWHESLAYIK